MGRGKEKFDWKQRVERPELRIALRSSLAVSGINAVRQEGNGCSTKHKESPTASTGGGEWENLFFINYLTIGTIFI